MNQADISIIQFVLTNRVETLIFLIVAAIIIILAYLLWRKWHENENLKYEFITIIAHTYRTPLTQMKWLIETLLGDEKEAYRRESLESMRQANQRLVSLTTSLIELTDSDNSSKSAYEFAPVNVVEIVKNVSDNLKNLFHEKNLFFGVQISEPDIMVNADRARLEFVLQTIMENACTYTPPGRNIDIMAVRDGKNAVISVKDNGIGMDKGEIAKLFTKFYRTKSAKAVNTDGFGVGLYMAQSIARRHGGKIEVFSEGKDRGTTFVVTLPALPATSAPAVQPDAAPIQQPQ